MMKWYVVHTQTGLEDKVKSLLELRVTAQGMKESIPQVVIPTEQISEIRSGKRRVTERRFFPGYILVEMELVDKTYAVIRALPGVSGFIGSGKTPTPLPKHEVDSILKRTEETRTKPSPKIIFAK